MWCCLCSGGGHQSEPPARPDAPPTLYEELHPAGSVRGQWAAAHEPWPPRWPLHVLPHHAHQDRPPMVMPHSLPHTLFVLPQHTFFLCIKAPKHQGGNMCVPHGAFRVHPEFTSVCYSSHLSNNWTTFPLRICSVLLWGHNNVSCMEHKQFSELWPPSLPSYRKYWSVIRNVKWPIQSDEGPMIPAERTLVTKVKTMQEQWAHGDASFRGLHWQEHMSCISQSAVSCTWATLCVWSLHTQAKVIASPPITCQHQNTHTHTETLFIFYMHMYCNSTSAVWEVNPDRTGERLRK